MANDGPTTDPPIPLPMTDQHLRAVTWIAGVTALLTAAATELSSETAPSFVSPADRAALAREVRNLTTWLHRERLRLTSEARVYRSL